MVFHFTSEKPIPDFALESPSLSVNINADRPVLNQYLPRGKSTKAFQEVLNGQGDSTEDDTFHIERHLMEAGNVILYAMDEKRLHQIAERLATIYDVKSRQRLFDVMLFGKEEKIY